MNYIILLLFLAFSLSFSLLADRFGITESRIMIAAIGIVVTALVGKFIFNKIQFWQQYLLMVFIVIVLLGTFNGRYLLELEFSLWQIIRSQIGTLFGIVVVIYGKSYFKNLSGLAYIKVVNLLGLLSVLILVLAFVEMLTGLRVAPVMLRSDSEQSLRLYLIGLDLYLCLIPVYLFLSRYAYALVGTLIGAITAGKVVVVTILVSYVFAFIREKRHRNRKLLGIFGIFGTLVLIPFGYSRLISALGVVDYRRLDQVHDAMNMFLSNAYSIMFGVGLGTRYSDGYLQYGLGIDELRAQVVNSMYDVENGVAYLLLRFGVFGTFVFCVIIWRSYTNIRSYVFVIEAIIYLGGSPVGFGFALRMLGYHFVNSYFDFRNEARE